MNAIHTAAALALLGSALPTVQAQVPDPASAEAPAGSSYRHLELKGGATLEYRLELPAGFSKDKAYPVLLAFPPGPQTRPMVEAGFDLYWGGGFAKDWVVVSPVTTSGSSFYTGAEAHIPALLDEVQKSVRVEGQRVHVAGPSNGGRSAFRFATSHPDRTASLFALPGFPPDEADGKRLDRLLGMPVELFVGGDDAVWVKAANEAEAKLRALGHRHVALNVYPGEGHTPATVTGALMFERLTLAHAHRMEVVQQEAAAAAALESFHQAAAEADGETYFALFAPGAIFLGTDPLERWTIAEFKAFAKPYFDDGRGWTYTATRRFVGLSPDGYTAWFDEDLTNASYGMTRGTGVLQRIGNDWRIAQYSLSIPVPNDLTKDLAKRIRGE